MKKILKIIKIFIVIAVIFALVFYWAFYDTQRIKGEEILEKVDSPDGRYTIVMYLNSGGATTDYAVLGVCVDNLKHTERNIYWKYHETESNVQWKSNSVVVINGRELTVPFDVYDWRH